MHLISQGWLQVQRSQQAFLLPMAQAATSSRFLHKWVVSILPLLALLSPAAAQNYRNVSLGSSLTTQGTRSWLSPSGDFAFGFLQASPGATENFLLAVWFDKIPEKTPVWFLRKDGATPLLQAGSRVELNSGGLLVLTDHTGNRTWTAPGGAAAYAAMLDTGNFVLVSGGSSTNGVYRWESFAYPTDTILPTQQLILGTDLVARLMETDYSNGRFKLAVQKDGNLVLYLLSPAPIGQYGPYWSSNTQGSGTSLIFDTSGNLYMANRNGTVVNVTSANVSTSGFYQRATLEHDGLFRHYIYQKNATGWSLAQQFPDDICRQLTTMNVGSGVCGYNALCTLLEKRPDCNCPEDYSFVDPNRTYMGCKPDFMPQSCSSSGGIDPAAGFMMLPIQNADWPFMDYEYFIGIDQETCSDGCLKDCFCAAAIYGGRRECWRKKLPLSNGRIFEGIDRTALLKASINASSGGNQPTNQPMNEKIRNRGIAALPAALLIGGLTFIILILAVGLLSVLLQTSQKGTTENQQLQQQSSDLSMVDSSMRRFTYKELEKATGDFKEELGRGAFGIVYKGAFSADIQFAAKKLDKLDLKDEQAEKEFVTEVKAIGLTHHKNLVRLLGYCNEGSHRLLVYEFMSNGSLTSLLFSSNGAIRLGWVQRATIACGIARGLFYLHEECSTQIIHCDIKPQNVLLDEQLNPKISDFGMAKLLSKDQTRTATGIRGTKGYVAPEWFRPVPITAKIDVYSFGVMLLEIICCKRAIEPVYQEEDAGESEAEILTFWVYDCYKDGRVDLLIGDDLEAMADINKVQRFVMVALWCIQEDPTLRPSMKKVTQMLEGAIDVSAPPDPSSFYSAVTSVT